MRLILQEGPKKKRFNQLGQVGGSGKLKGITKHIVYTTGTNLAGRKSANVNLAYKASAALFFYIVSADMWMR